MRCVAFQYSPSPDHGPGRLTLSWALIITPSISSGFVDGAKDSSSEKQRSGRQVIVPCQSLPQPTVNNPLFFVKFRVSEGSTCWSPLFHLERILLLKENVGDRCIYMPRLLPLALPRRQWSTIWPWHNLSWTRSKMPWYAASCTLQF